MKSLFVIGDVHGCFHTLQALLTQVKWDTELVVSVGDLIDRGLFSAQCIALFHDLVAQGKAQVVMGNHEHEATLHRPNLPNERWLEWAGAKPSKAMSD